VGEHRLEFVKRLLSLDGPGEVLVLLQEPVEGQAFLAEPRDEAGQGGEAPQHLLHPFEVSNRAHSVEGCDFLGVGLDALLENTISQQHAVWHPEDAFFRVQFYPVGSRAIERGAQVVNQVVHLPVFHDYVIYVCLNGLPDVVSENVLHAPLVHSARISEAKRHRYVAKHSEWRDEGGRELIGLLHLHLVVPGIGIKET
jgi:hypothetical protein